MARPMVLATRAGVLHSARIERRAGAGKSLGVPGLSWADRTPPAQDAQEDARH